MTQPETANSLRSRLVWHLLPLQAGLLSLLAILVVGTLWATGLILDNRDEDYAIDIVSRALTRDAAGQLSLRPILELQRLRAATPDLWFTVRDRHGQSLTEGPVPPEFARIGDALDEISQARLGWQLLDDDPRKPAARLKRVETAAGSVQILTATQGSMSASKAVMATATVFAGFVLPSLALMTLATFIATPIVVRRALKGLGAVAAQAGQIDIQRRGSRLPVDAVPSEITPLVNAVNDALARLDDGHSRHKRFLADAAHEMRTPIAILTTRLESLPPGQEKTRLIEDAARLATLAEQLLDVQRLDCSRHEFTRVDLVALGQRVAADLAPLAIAAGYDLSFDTDAGPIETRGDEAALERALRNLVQNAIQHGGRRGTIRIAVSRPATVDVVDEGDGVPEDQRGLIFEPFYRVQPLDRGAGLGLNMVREIAQLHHGHVSVIDSPGGGACFRLMLPAAPEAS